MSDADLRHPDLLTAEEAIAYLKLDHAAASPEAARRLIQTFGQQGKIHPIKWAKSHLYARGDLDAFVAWELAAFTRAKSESPCRS